ncbi:hypothetical protein AOQ84DRAFT_109601 [Glonium stellatum]|uniref:Uncharacterized protein n=1 Tax=Glonium stellatum TaxID=574774 RepID=A0A8E2EV11_9PEZI|nr:hypothetical protein AOQ84DRAFT_109601 [Glonium stellatum]
MNWFKNEIRPIEGSECDTRVPLLKDERIWIRWPVWLFYRLPKYLGHVALSVLRPICMLIPVVLGFCIKMLEANPPYFRVSKRYGRH